MVDINFLWLFGHSPGLSEISNPERRLASEIYSADGVMIGKFYSENRTPVDYENVNPIFWRTLIDTEDERFYDHHGVDFEAMAGAFKDAILRNKPRGASTITQQLAKNLFRTRASSSAGPLCKVPGLGMLITKTKEWIVAFKLEFFYSKEEILEMYANTVEFGGNVFGLKTAAKTYFDKTPKDLSVEECAVLVGMLKAVTTYNPRFHIDKSKQRRNIVMKQMVAQGDLTKAECDSLCQLPITLSLNIEKNLAGEAPYFREAVAKDLEEWCQENDVDIYNDGLKIYTTLDTRMQKNAEKAVREHMRELQQEFRDDWGTGNPWVDENGNEISGFVQKMAQNLPVYQQLSARFDGNTDSINYHLNKVHKVKLFSYDGEITREMSTLDSIAYSLKMLHCGFVAMEPQTGHVKAWVGDVDFNTWQYDKVTARRQPGSTFKLFVYTEAMNQGFTPCDKRKDEYFCATMWDKQKHQEVKWEPTNANGRFSNDSLTLKTAFARSVNSIAVGLAQKLGIERVAETAQDMGVTSKLDTTPALALGASEVTLIEMANAYSTVANNGVKMKPVFVTRILDADGDEIYSADEVRGQEAIPQISAFYMQRLLMGGLTESGGTSRGMSSYIGGFSDTDFGGKTGTTNNNTDGWYMCVTPNLVCGAWVGGEYNSIHFRSGRLGQGSHSAMPICGKFMYSTLLAFANYHGRFVVPEDIAYESDYNCAEIYKPKPEIPDTIVFPDSVDFTLTEEEERNLLNLDEEEEERIKQQQYEERPEM